MNCPNCGAPMELFEQRRYYFCTHCGTFHFIETPPVDGVRVLEHPAEPRACPACMAPLVKAMLDDYYPVEHCERCRGILIERASFGNAVAQRRGRQSGPGSIPQPVDPRELERDVPCPSCRRTMDVHPYYGPGNVIIDSCVPCALVWLDFRELNRITDAPGRDRGRAPFFGGS